MGFFDTSTNVFVEDAINRSMQRLTNWVWDWQVRMDARNPRIVDADPETPATLALPEAKNEEAINEL